MNHTEHIKRLEELYKIALDLKDVTMCLEILHTMIQSGAAEAGKKEKV